MKQIRDISQAAIVVHRDRDYLDDDEAEIWKKDIRSIGAEPFITSELDVEGYFCSQSYVVAKLGSGDPFKFEKLAAAIDEGEIEGIITSYVNGRIDLERKGGTIGKLDIGKLSAAASKKVHANPLSYMKGKQKLAKLRHVLHTLHAVRYDIDEAASLPNDPELAIIAKKHFGVVASKIGLTEVAREIWTGAVSGVSA